MLIGLSWMSGAVGTQNTAAHMAAYGRRQFTASQRQH